MKHISWRTEHRVKKNFWENHFIWIDLDRVLFI